MNIFIFYFLSVKSSFLFILPSLVTKANRHISNNIAAWRGMHPRNMNPHSANIRGIEIELFKSREWGMQLDIFKFGEYEYRVSQKKWNKNKNNYTVDFIPPPPTHSPPYVWNHFIFGHLWPTLVNKMCSYWINHTTPLTGSFLGKVRSKVGFKKMHFLRKYHSTRKKCLTF